MPSENPNLEERGLILTDFVDRVGDPVGIVAADGSTHRADGVLADALRAMLHAVGGPAHRSRPLVSLDQAVPAMRRGQQRDDAG